MIKNKNKPGKGTVASASFLGEPALLEGEDPVAYKELRDKFIDCVKPSDIFEQIYIEDIINAQWEILRWRRLLAALLNSEIYLAARDQMTPTVNYFDAMKLYDGCRRQDPESIEALKTVVAAIGSSMDDLAARTLHKRLNEVERINHLLGVAQIRRAQVTKELSMHREGLSKLLKGAIATVEGVEYKEVDSTQANDGLPDKCGEAKAA